MHTLVCLLPRTRQVSPAKCEQRPGLDDVMNSRARRHASMLADVSNINPVYHSTRTDSDTANSFTLDAIDCYILGEAHDAPRSSPGEHSSTRGPHLSLL